MLVSCFLFFSILINRSKKKTGPTSKISAVISAIKLVTIFKMIIALKKHTQIQKERISERGRKSYQTNWNCCIANAYRCWPKPELQHTMFGIVIAMLYNSIVNHDSLQCFGIMIEISGFCCFT